MLLFACFSQRPEGPLQGYEYTLNATMVYPLENYKLHYTRDGALVIDTVSPEGESRTIPAPTDLPEKIDALVRKYKLWQLKRDYQPPFTVYDGYSWQLYIKYAKNSISSGGNNANPSKKQREGIEAINALLKAVVEEQVCLR